MMAQALRDYSDELAHPAAAAPVRWLARDTLPDRDARALQRSLADAFASSEQRGSWSAARRVFVIVATTTALWISIFVGVSASLA